MLGYIIIFPIGRRIYLSSDGFFGFLRFVPRPWTEHMLQVFGENNLSFEEQFGQFFMPFGVRLQNFLCPLVLFVDDDIYFRIN